VLVSQQLHSCIGYEVPAEQGLFFRAAEGRSMGMINRRGSHGVARNLLLESCPGRMILEFPSSSCIVVCVQQTPGALLQAVRPLLAPEAVCAGGIVLSSGKTDPQIVFSFRKILGKRLQEWNRWVCVCISAYVRAGCAGKQALLALQLAYLDSFL